MDFNHKDQTKNTSATNRPNTKPEAKKGRPRNEESKRKILTVAQKMGREKTSFREVSIEAIANQAKVSKATIYRWWKNKSELLREACIVGHFRNPDTGALSRDMRAIIHQEIAIQTNQINRAVFAGLMAEAAEQAQKPTPANQYNGCPYAVEKKELLETIFEAAIERGEWEGFYNAFAAHEVSFGAVYFRCIQLGGTLSNLEIEGLVECVLRIAKLNPALDLH